MDQKICDIKNRIVLIFANTYVNYTSVFLYNNAMHSQRQCYPLVFLHTAIVMGIQISQICVLIKRILLNIKTRGVNMRTKNAHAFGKLLCSHMKQSYDLLHTNCINLIASL